MIDITNEVFTEVYNYLVEKYGSISMSNDISITPADFPHITFTQDSNVVYTRTIDTGSNENDVDVMFGVNIYTKDTERVSLANELLAIIDEKMRELGFTRTHTSPIPDLTYYRLTARYQGIVSKNYEGTNYIYRR